MSAGWGGGGGFAGGGFEGGYREPAIVFPHDFAGGGGEHVPRLVGDAVSVGEPAGGIEGDRVAQRLAEVRQVGAGRAGGRLGGRFVDGGQLWQRGVPRRLG